MTRWKRALAPSYTRERARLCSLPTQHGEDIHERLGGAYPYKAHNESSGPHASQKAGPGGLGGGGGGVGLARRCTVVVVVIVTTSGTI